MSCCSGFSNLSISPRSPPTRACSESRTPRFSTWPDGKSRWRSGSDQRSARTAEDGARHAPGADERGFPAKLTEMKGHTHSYADSGKEVTRDAWDFLRKEGLPGDPQYHRYRFPAPSLRAEERQRIVEEAVIR